MRPFRWVWCARLAVPVSLGLALLTVLAPTARAAGSSSNPSAVAPRSTGFLGNISWNGQAVATANDPSHALSVQFNQGVTLDYAWVLTPGSPPTGLTPITDARLQFMFLGQAVFTKDEVPSSPLPLTGGSVNMTLDLSSDRYLVSGTYLLTASLLGQNSTTDFVQSFYISVSPPFHLVASTVAIGLATLYELYATATVGAHALSAGAAAQAGAGARRP